MGESRPVRQLLDVHIGLGLAAFGDPRVGGEGMQRVVHVLENLPQLPGTPIAARRIR